MYIAIIPSEKEAAIDNVKQYCESNFSSGSVIYKGIMTISFPNGEKYSAVKLMVPDDWDAMTCNEATSIDGWFFHQYGDTWKQLS